jgi:hypothetical protein
MKTIKKPLSAYKDADGNIIWNKIVGKNALVRFEEIAECVVFDYFIDPDTGKTYIKLKDRWVLLSSSRDIICVFEPVNTATVGIDEQLKKLVDSHKEKDYYLPKMPWPFPKPKSNTGCTKCGLDFGNGPIGYVCPHSDCHLGLGGAWCQSHNDLFRAQVEGAQSSSVTL